MSEESNTPPPKAAGWSAGRKRGLAIATGAFFAIGVAYGAYWALVARHFQSTDDAYVSGNVVQITPQISGTVIAIGADDTQFVKTGQTLVRLDPADAKVALDQSEAQLGKTVRDVRGLFATTAQLQATVNVHQSEVAKATDDLARRERLATSGAVSAEELHHARDALDSAKSGLIAAQQQLAANSARIDRTTIENHPEVLAAAARVRDAYLTYARTELPAPVSGYIAKRAVQLGQRVGPGAPLMAIVPLDQVWVDANFKERQLANMRVGQPVTLSADLYGGRVTYHGKVVGFGAGTGSAFALLPAQNATGNWIKIVQRVPVRVALDPQELAAHPLQIGLSMNVEVDTRERSGDRLPQLAQTAPAYATSVFGSPDVAANERVKAIIAANGSGAARAVAEKSTLEPPTGTGAARTADLVAARRAGSSSHTTSTQ
jgi:membrane fusion protein (multidrug efflux system)